MDEFRQFPCCWASIDGCHIPIKCPPGGLEACKEYHNFKNFYSIVLMGVVDSHYRFVWGSCEFPRDSHDAVIFRSTDLWNSIQGFMPTIGKAVGDITLPPLVVGDPAFPLRLWLMRPFTMLYWHLSSVTSTIAWVEHAWSQKLHRKSESSRDQARITTQARIL